jgi:hypothetical protein
LCFIFQIVSHFLPSTSFRLWSITSASHEAGLASMLHHTQLLFINFLLILGLVCSFYSSLMC